MIKLARICIHTPLRFLLATIVVGLFARGSALSASLDPTTTPTREQLQPSWQLTPEYIRLRLAFPGLYRVYARDLFAAGLPRTVDPATLALWNEAQLVPLALTARNSHRLDDDDFIEFIGDAPRGTFSTFKPYNFHNVYFLTWGGGQTLRYREVALERPTLPSGDLSFWEFMHLEEDNYYRESRLPRGITDNFYWSHYATNDRRTFPIRLDFPDLDRRFADHVKLTFRIFGYSDVPGLEPAHKFSIQYGDDESSDSPRYDLGTFQFNYRGNYDFETSLPVSKIGFRQRIVFKTPPDRENVIDSISLDWIRVQYPRKLDATKRHWFVFNSNVCTETPPPYRFAVRGAGPGARVFCPSRAVVYHPATETRRIVVEAEDRQTTFFLATPAAVLTVDAIEHKRRRNLARAFTTATELLVLYDPELHEAVARYVRWREARGFVVAAVDVSEIFDMMNSGFADDLTLKRFIRYAAAHCPKLRYLLLFGDSTQDYRLARTFDQPDPPRVGLPIHWIESPGTIRTGGYVDDNWYASFKSANTPDLAIGRIPAANTDQAHEYVRKLIEYETFRASRDDGMLVISSVEAHFQDLARDIQTRHKDHFSTVALLFPETAHAAREVERLRHAIDHGVQLLYYIGHGGAFVWRVGPVDYARQKDLFTPADVASLRNALHYPIILASSCYTTAFDADFSIGEAFLLQPRAGAIAVIGSPWKSSVYEDHAFNARFLEKYVSPKFQRLGEAYQAAKEAQRPKDDSYVDVQTFTLLGDPTLELVPRK